MNFVIYKKKLIVIRENLDWYNIRWIPVDPEGDKDRTLIFFKLDFMSSPMLLFSKLYFRSTGKRDCSRRF